MLIDPAGQWLGLAQVGTFGYIHGEPGRDQLRRLSFALDQSPTEQGRGTGRCAQQSRYRRWRRFPADMEQRTLRAALGLIKEGPARSRLVGDDRAVPYKTSPAVLPVDPALALQHLERAHDGRPGHAELAHELCLRREQRAKRVRSVLNATLH